MEMNKWNELNREFGILGRVCVKTGCGGLPKVVLAHASGAAAEVYLLGAHVASWKTADGKERLFLSGRSLFEEGKAIRGGVPLVFPQFGDGPLPKHGLVRTRSWKLLRTSVSSAGVVEAVFGLAIAVADCAAWPHDCTLEYTVRLDSELVLDLKAVNAGTKPLAFQAALHTYFAADDIHKAGVCGLNGREFLDSLKNRQRGTETRESIPFAAETDRIYLDVPSELGVTGTTSEGGGIRIRTRNLPDAVVWNPWIEKSKKLDDFGDDEYRRMVCVETGTVIPGVTLPPGLAWESVTTLAVV